MDWALIGKICVFAFLGFAVLGVIIFVTVTSAMKRSGAWQLATHYARNHPYVQRKVGTVTGFGWFPKGSIQREGPSGHAELQVGVKGERGEAVMYYKMTCNMGEWRIDEAVCKTSGERVVLHEAAPAPGEGEPPAAPGQ